MPHSSRLRSLLVALLAGALAPSSALAAPPPNDARAAAETLTTSVTGRTLAEATVEPGEVLTCGANTYNMTVWFRYTASASGHVTIDVPIFHRAVSVFRGTATTSAGCAASETAGSSIEVAVRAGEVLLVQIGRLPAAAAFNYSLTLSFGAAPANDDRAAASTISGPAIDQTFQLTNATTEPGEGLTCEGVGYDTTIWFRWTAPAAGSATVKQTVGARALSVYRGGTQSCATTNDRELSFAGLAAGETLLIQLGRGPGATTFSARLQITFTPPLATVTPTPTPAPLVRPPNDMRADARPLTPPSGTTSGSLANGTTEPSEKLTCRPPDLGITAFDRTVWFTFTAPARGALKVRVPTASRIIAGYRGTRVYCAADTFTIPVISRGEVVRLQLGRQASATKGFTYQLDYWFAPSPDQDGDGYDSGGQDCNDNDRRINPDALDKPGDGIDQNCDGADTRRSRQVEITLRVRSSDKDAHGHVVAPDQRPVVGVRYVGTGRVAAGATVTLRCYGDGCRRKKQTKVLRHAGTVRFTRPLRRLDKNRDRFTSVSLEVSITYPKARGQYSNWTVTRGRPSTPRKNLCTFPPYGRVAKCR
jgi:hypothetical protein